VPLTATRRSRPSRSRGIRRPIEIKPLISPAAWNSIVEIILETSGNDRAAAWRKLAAQFQQRDRDDLAAAAVAQVLRDLHLQGWRMQVDRRQLWVIPPLVNASDGERWVPLVESIIPDGDISHDGAPFLSINQKATSRPTAISSFFISVSSLSQCGPTASSVHG
jgi:hypothetical protein